MNKGCNICTCNSDGEWECSEYSCEYSPCEDKICGDACSKCPPWQLTPPCKESPELKTCNDRSQCVIAPVECTMPSSNESSSTESSAAEDSTGADETTDNEPDSDEEDSTSDQDPDLTSPIVTHCEDTKNFNDPTRFDTLQIDGDLLSAMVGYSGSCIDDQFRMCWNGLFLESAPEQAVLVLGHEDFDDSCDDWVEDLIRFDLSPLRDAWLSEHEGQLNGSIQVHVISRVDNNVQAKILYEF